MPNEPALTVPTVADICYAGLLKAGIVGVDEAIEQPMLNQAFYDLNDLLAQWQRNRYLVWRLATYSFTSTGAKTYLVGMGQRRIKQKRKKDLSDHRYNSCANRSSKIVTESPMRCPFASE